MPRRVFDLPTSTHEPIEFGLGQDPVYRCVDDLPARAVYLLTTGKGAAQETIDFIRACLVDGEEDRFDAQLARKGKGQVVGQAVLSDVLDYLIGVYADRPTRPPVNSAGGRPVTTDSSPLVSASLV